MSGLRFLLLLLGVVGVLGRATPAAAEPPAAAACPAVESDLGLRSDEALAWSSCEKWVWSCIRTGREANLFERQCFDPRSPDNSAARRKWQDAVFQEPGRFAEPNAIGAKFLTSLLSVPHYAQQITSAGVRVYGGYYKDHVNLENVSSDKNLVLDGSIFMSGLRLSNFRGDRNLSLDGSNIRGELILLRLRLGGSLFLNRGVYDRIDMRDARIGASLEASRSIFNDELRMDRARVEGKVYLIKSRITSLNAWDAEIGGSLELRMADIRVGIDMTGTSVNGDARFQRITFGQAGEGGQKSCNWDLRPGFDDILGDIIEKAPADDAQQRALEEVMGARPAMHKDKLVCVKGTVQRGTDVHKDLILRDMRIKGTLCLFDVSGELAPRNAGEMASAGRASAIETISIDGTQANSTVLKWKTSPSRTLWRAVNFKTNYMLLNLDNQPAQHYIDNIDIGFLAFVRGEPAARLLDSGDDDRFLCDITPADNSGEGFMASSRETHERIVRFFTGPSNVSRSAQPFAKVAERLEDSGASSTYLKTQLSAFRLGKVCTTSAFSKEWSALDDLGWLAPWTKVRRAYQNAVQKGELRDPREHPSDALVEANRLLWDGVCRAGMKVYEKTVSYGHEPYNLFLYIVGFVALFWFLLRFDSRPGGDGGAVAPRLGLIYAVDTFTPLPQLKLDRSTARREPNRRALRIYLKLHKFIGVVFAVLVFLFIYRATK